MATRSSVRDPRSVITPDAFEVSSDLLGIPLAAPSRRAIALAIDGIVIGVITLVTSSFALILGVVAAAFFVRAGFKRTEVRGSVFGRAMRLSVGCLGVLIALITAVVWSSAGLFDVEVDDGVSPPGDVRVGPGEVVDQIVAAARLTRLRRAASLEEASLVVQDFLQTPAARGIDPDELRSALTEAAPDSAAWSAEWEAEIDRLLAAPATPLSTSELEAIDEDVAEYSVDEALREYAAVLSADPSDEGAIARRRGLEARLGPMLAADTLRTLEGRVQRLQDEVERRDRALARAQAELADSGVGIFTWLRGVADELGFGFGWAALYMTVFLSWWNGQTVGKKLMRIRVVRLDGERITWWVAFERAGGYAAGLATGLLGFAQVWWDANRQAIHDRIVGTVVVVDGAEKVLDWESAL